jgi:hypothetical protein
MNPREELHTALTIRRHLNDSACALPSGTAERLRAARERALAKQRKPAGGLAGAAGGVFSFDWMAQLAPLVVLVGGLFAMAQWHQSQQVAEIADIDMQMLVDELPPNAYVDKGFGEWLSRAEQ